MLIYIKRRQYSTLFLYFVGVSGSFRETGYSPSLEFGQTIVRPILTICGRGFIFLFSNFGLSGFSLYGFSLRRLLYLFFRLFRALLNHSALSDLSRRLDLFSSPTPDCSLAWARRASVIACAMSSSS